MKKTLALTITLIALAAFPAVAQISSWSGALPRVWGSVIFSNLTSSYTAAPFTTPMPITITRMEMFLNTAPSGCATNANVNLWDSNLATILAQIPTTNGTQVYDTGPISVSVPAGHVLRVRISPAAVTCTTAPANANVTVQYQ